MDDSSSSSSSSRKDDLLSQEDLNEFLTCQHLLSDDDILEILSGTGDEKYSTDSWHRLKNNNRCDERVLLRQAFHRRKHEIRLLTAEYKETRNGGTARIDEDGRLVRDTEPPQPPRANLLPVDNVANNNNDNNNDDNNNNDNGDDQRNNPQLLRGPRNDGINFNNNIDNLIHQGQLEEQHLEQQRREAEATISLAVQDLRNIRVPGEDFEVILLDPQGRPARNESRNNNNNNRNHNQFLMNLTLRRIAITMFIAIAAFTCALLQILPLSSMKEQLSVNTDFDVLLYELLNVRGWKDHVNECSGGLADRSIEKLGWFQKMMMHKKTMIDCSKGVLHIPSKRVLLEDYSARSSSEQEKTMLQEYSLGVNISWFMPCSDRRPSHLEQQNQQLIGCMQQTNKTDLIDEQGECAANRQIIYDQCFRGIHDNIIQDKEIMMALMMGDALINDGGDHFDVQFDVSLLHRWTPSIVQKVRNLLDVTYLAHLHNNTIPLEDEKESQNESSSRSKINTSVQPVAFRILTTGPMDGRDVKLRSDGQERPLHRTPSSALNETTYIDWITRSRMHNERAHYQSYFRLWPFRSSTKRDTCDLKFDLQGDSRFCIRTSISLANGAGEDYRGGTNLFVDNHLSNYANPSRRIARGVSIDGSKGRIVVNTGGSENLQCRFPTRSGLRAELQIWWNCEAK
jgi:hypothetical protein